MPDPNEYDLSFRPQSYWGPQSLDRYINSRVKGELRRQGALEEIKKNKISNNSISESLSDQERSFSAAVHPWFMGGEYLPDLKSNEVEIARIVSRSVTLDVISIRARKTKNRIFYRIVDEYAEEHYRDYHLTKKTSKRPLTLGEIIHLIDNAVENGLVGAGRQFHYEEGAQEEEIFEFESAVSAFYPQLQNWYRDANEEWLLSIKEKEASEELEQKYKENYLDGISPLDMNETRWRSDHCEHLLQIADEVWESRYLMGQTSKSSKEEQWRSRNQKKLYLKKIIKDHVSRSEWNKPRVLGYGGLAAQKGYELITKFVTVYFEKNGVLPDGIHQVEGRKVKFPK